MVLRGMALKKTPVFFLKGAYHLGGNTEQGTQRGVRRVQVDAILPFVGVSTSDEPLRFGIEPQPTLALYGSLDLWIFGILTLNPKMALLRG